MLILILNHMFEDISLTGDVTSSHRRHHSHHYKGYIPTLADHCHSTRAESRSFSWNHGDGHQKTNNFLSVGSLPPSACGDLPLPWFPSRRLRASNLDRRLRFYAYITGRRLSYFSTVSHFCLLDLGKAEGTGGHNTQQLWTAKLPTVTPSCPPPPPSKKKKSLSTKIWY